MLLNIHNVTYEELQSEYFVTHVKHFVFNGKMDRQETEMKKWGSNIFRGKLILSNLDKEALLSCPKVLTMARGMLTLDLSFRRNKFLSPEHFQSYM